MKRIVANTGRRYVEDASRLVNAIAKLASNNYALDNFEQYVSIHGDSWYDRYASDLNGLISELEHFASITN